MKKILLLLLILSYQQLSAQTSWTTSTNLQSTFYGNSDSIYNYWTNGSFSIYNLNYNLFDYTSPNVLKQPMKTNLVVINDSLYIIDSSKQVNSPTSFYSKSIATDSIQVVLDTNQNNYYLNPPGLNPNRYNDESNNLQDYYGPYALTDHEVKLNLGHYAQFQNKVIRYKSIYYSIQSISNTSVNYSPNWQSSALLPDSAMPAPNSNDFFINIENNKIVFYHASKILDNCYNLNLSQISNDSMYIDLHPSRLLSMAFPLSNSNKTLATDYSNSPRFIVADINDFSDSLTVGYYYEHILNNASALQAFDWITIYKDANNVITYSSFNPQILNIGTPVPYQEFQFSVSEAKNYNEINWVAIGMENIERFELLRSTNGVDFEEIYTTKAIGQGNSQVYTFDDYDVKPKLFYRIRTEDQDGIFQYSKTVIIVRKNPVEITISPIPTKDNLNITGLQNTDYRLLVYTLTGKLLSKELIRVENNATKYSLNNLSAGAYILSIENLETNEQLTKKIMKE